MRNRSEIANAKHPGSSQVYDVGLKLAAAIGGEVSADGRFLHKYMCFVKSDEALCIKC